MTRTALVAVSVAILVCSVNCGGGSGSAPTTPTAPTAPTAAATRVISVSGNLAFGEVLVGASRELSMTISNSGNAALTVTGLSLSGGLGPHVYFTWSSGQIAAGGSQVVVVGFAPTASGTFNGSLIVSGDQTGGNNALSVSGTSIPNFAGRWIGGHRIDQCNGTGSMQDLICGSTRGQRPPGSVLSFEANLVQNGSSVTGTVNVGGVEGPASGVVTSGFLTLRGTLTSASGFTAVITSWSTSLGTPTSWSGFFTYDLTFRGVPGVAGVVASVNNITKR